MEWCLIVLLVIYGVQLGTNMRCVVVPRQETGSQSPVGIARCARGVADLIKSGVGGE